jgi:hypothetical protein
MKRIRITRGSFTGLKENQLRYYVNNLLQHCADVPALEPFHEHLDAIQKAVDHYGDQLVESVQGGRDRTHGKNFAKEALYDRLDRFALALEMARVPVEVIVAIGLDPARRGQRSNGIELSAPQDLRGKSTGRSGQVELTYTLLEPTHVHTTALEWSADEGVTWQNGIYSRRRRVRISGLPVRQDVLFRARSLGSAGHSAWSEVVRVFVL